jgi:tetratricopeptide (TPR) repeat protein
MNSLQTVKSHGVSAASADISAFRRTYVAGVVTRASLLIITVVCAVVATLPGPARAAGTTLLIVAMGVYLLLSWRSMQVSREAMSASLFLARGQKDEAERVLRASLRRFSLFPAHRVIELYHLAALRQGQGRYTEAAELASAVITAQAGPTSRRRFRRSMPDIYGLGAAAAGGRTGRAASGAAGNIGSDAGGVGEAGIEVASLLLRIECLLELRDLHGAYDGIARLASVVLPLPESVRLLASRSRYELAIGAYDLVLHDLPTKLAMVDLMPASPAIETLAGFAAAAHATGRQDLARWLITRAVAASTGEGSLEMITTTAPQVADLARAVAAEIRSLSHAPAPPNG